jgi:hypothetical protein
VLTWVSAPLPVKQVNSVIVAGDSVECVPFDLGSACLLDGPKRRGEERDMGRATGVNTRARTQVAPRTRKPF